jgi:hypothetical protein
VILAVVTPLLRGLDLTPAALDPAPIVGAPTHALRDRAPTARAAIPASPVRPPSMEEVMETAIPAAANPTLRGLHLNPADRALVADV